MDIVAVACTATFRRSSRGTVEQTVARASPKETEGNPTSSGIWGITVPVNKSNVEDAALGVVGKCVVTLVQLESCSRRP
jgi:hypothetical protein